MNEPVLPLTIQADRLEVVIPCHHRLVQILMLVDNNEEDKAVAPVRMGPRQTVPRALRHKQMLLKNTRRILMPPQMTPATTCLNNFKKTLAQLTTWNPVLGYPEGQNCTTEFWEVYDYCVGVLSSSTSNTTNQASTTTNLPSPTQTGIIASCNKYAEAKSGDYCYQFAQDNNITTDDLYAWNTLLGPNGADCSTKFQAGYEYCVSHTSI